MTTLAMLAALSFHGWLDGYYAFNHDDPVPKLNFFSGVGTSGHHANQLALNAVALEVTRDSKPFGFHLIAGAGDGFDVVHLAEPHRHPLRNLYEASLSYDAKVAQFEAGIYPSHIGFEGFFTKDNWNYTHGWLGELSPYYQAGIKISRSFGSKWSGQIHVLRGWQNVTASLPAAIGTQVAYSSGSLSASFNAYVDRNRKFGDFIGTYKATPKFSVGGSLDGGRQQPASWLGVGLYGRYAFNDKHAVAIRGERFRDPDAGISGFAQKLNEITATYEFRPASRWIFKVEGRRDHSTAPVFDGSKDQTLALAGAVAVF